MAGNFNIHTQCPQIYIYILSVITAALVALRFGNLKTVLYTLLMGAIVTVMLMGVDYCTWTFQWFTWILAALSLLAATANILFFFVGDKPTYDEIQQRHQ